MEGHAASQADRQSVFQSSQKIVTSNLGLKLLSASLLILGSLPLLAKDSLSPLVDGKVPQDVACLWKGYDPRVEPLETEVVREWEQDGLTVRYLRYRIGTFKGKAARMAAFYAFPKKGKDLPSPWQEGSYNFPHDRGSISNN